jgi:hypothetical protein
MEHWFKGSPKAPKESTDQIWDEWLWDEDLWKNEQ